MMPGKHACRYNATRTPDACFFDSGVCEKKGSLCASRLLWFPRPFPTSSMLKTRRCGCICAKKGIFFRSQQTPHRHTTNIEGVGGRVVKAVRMSCK